MTKKAAVMLYPLFSMQEISCTTELFAFNRKEIVTFAARKEPVRSEDGFMILPDRSFDEFCRDEFDCLILPGIWEPLPVMLDERNIRFVEQFKGDDDILIAGISAGPLLLGKAGLLDGKRFNFGVYEDFLDVFPVVPRDGFLRKPLVEDGNLITAVGEAYREFAIAVARKLGFACSDDIFSGVTGKNLTEEDVTYRMSPELLAEAREYWAKFM